MFSSATAVLTKDASFEVVPPKSTFGAAVAFEPSAFLRKATWAFSSTVTVFRKTWVWPSLMNLLFFWLAVASL